MSFRSAHGHAACLMLSLLWTMLTAAAQSSTRRQMLMRSSCLSVRQGWTNTPHSRFRSSLDWQSQRTDRWPAQRWGEKPPRLSHIEQRHNFLSSNQSKISDPKFQTWMHLVCRIRCGSDKMTVSLYLYSEGLRCSERSALYLGDADADVHAATIVSSCRLPRASRQFVVMSHWRITRVRQLIAAWWRPDHQRPSTPLTPTNHRLTDYYQQVPVHHAHPSSQQPQPRRIQHAALFQLLQPICGAAALSVAAANRPDRFSTRSLAPLRLFTLSATFPQSSSDAAGTADRDDDVGHVERPDWDTRARERRAHIALSLVEWFSCCSGSCCCCCRRSMRITASRSVCLTDWCLSVYIAKVGRLDVDGRCQLLFPAYNIYNASCVRCKQKQHHRPTSYEHYVQLPAYLQVRWKFIEFWIRMYNHVFSHIISFLSKMLSSPACDGSSLHCYFSNKKLEEFKPPPTTVFYFAT